MAIEQQDGEFQQGLPSASGLAHALSAGTVCKDLIARLEALRAEIEQKAELGRTLLDALPPPSRTSGENLLHYLGLRSEDLRGLQSQLLRLGLSTLGRAEPHVLPNINAVLHNLYLISGANGPGVALATISSDFDDCDALLHQNAIRLLGDEPRNRSAYIMVTLPTEAAQDYLLLHQLLDSGMDCVRINCAHDGPAVWSGMIRNLRHSERIAGRRCRILMDLAGPKLRTGPMKKIPAVLKIRPVRGKDGKVIRAARIWLTAAPGNSPETGIADAVLTLDANWLATIEPGDRIRLCDTRGARRTWQVKHVSGDGCWAEARKTAYLVNGTILRLRGADGSPARQAMVANLPPEDSFISLRTGDILFLSSRHAPGTPALHDQDGDLLSPGVVALPIAEIYRDTRPGEAVYFDDGRIGGIIESVAASHLQVRITHTRGDVERLTSDKGINFPESNLELAALSPKDLEDLEFAARHADMIGLSFANSADDVRALGEHLRALGAAEIGVVVKIETQRGFANLPGILLEALRFPACGVMIARGDLAVECGFERLAEVQEEILWVCEAAHVPVIWATQVLEALTKYGHATRAEITDAAMGQAAECVMLNKGAHIALAVHVLNDILERMQQHRAKKRSMLRKLQLASVYRAGNLQPARE